MRYVVKAYLCTNFAGLMDELEIDIPSEADDFIWENCQKGYNCTLTDNETGKTYMYYAENFNEETEDVFESVHDENAWNEAIDFGGIHSVNTKELYTDLRMEQQEQM